MTPDAALTDAACADSLGEVDAKAFIEAVAAEAAPSSQRVQVECDEDILLSAAQRALIGGILREAVANAFRHAYPAHPRGKVWVSLSREHGRLRLSVRDNGPGMPDLSDRQTPGLDRIRAAADALHGFCRIDNRNYGGAEVRVTFRDGA